MVINVIGNKGGIGKTTISAYLAEYLIQKNKKIICIDTDPENKSFTAYHKLKSINIQLKNPENNNIEKQGFDEMIQIILDNKEKDIVIDNGSGSFNPWINYMAENEILSLFEDENIENVIVGVISGGGNTLDSLNGLNTLLEFFDINFIVFNNQLLGETIYNGKELHTTKTVQNNIKKIIGIVDIPKKDEYQTDDIVLFTKYRMLFSDLKANDEFGMMQKRRLFAYRDSIFKQIEQFIKI